MWDLNSNQAIQVAQVLLCYNNTVQLSRRQSFLDQYNRSLHTVTMVNSGMASQNAICKNGQIARYKCKDI